MPELLSATFFREADAIEFVETWHPGNATTEFVAPEWILSSWKHLPELGSPAVAVVQDGPDWAALAFSEVLTPSGRQLTLAGAPLGDEHDIAVSSTGCAAQLTPLLLQLLDQAAGKHVHVTLDALAPNGHLARLLESAPPWQPERQAAPVISLSKLHVNPKGHARRLRRLGGAGATSFDVTSGPLLTVAEGEGFLRRRFESWAQQGRTGELPAVQHFPGFPRFMSEVMHRLAQRDMARIRVLRVDGQQVAEDLYFGPAGDPLLYMRGYSQKFREYSPGRILLEDSLLEMAERGYGRVRTGRGDEPYKFQAGAVGEYVLRATLQPN